MPDSLKDQLEAVIAGQEATGQADAPGYDWFNLSTAEEEVFEIDRARFPRMVITHHCYEAFKGMTDTPTWNDALLDQARQQRPGWCGKPPTIEEFQHFAKAYGGLTFREAYAIFYKMEFWTQRLGVVDFADEGEVR